MIALPFSFSFSTIPMNAVIKIVSADGDVCENHYMIQYSDILHKFKAQALA